MMIEDAYDFFLGEGIHHDTLWDGHQHHVANQKLTTNELCVRVKEILEQSTLLVYLDRESDVIMRYFISWFSLIQVDIPILVWVDEEFDDGHRERQFFYETFSGRVERFYTGPAMQIPPEAFESSQMSLHVENGQGNLHVDMEKCQMGSCPEDASNTIKVKGGLSICVCDSHKSGIDEQLSKVDERKKRKAVERREKRKLRPKKQKVKYVS